MPGPLEEIGLALTRLSKLLESGRVEFTGPPRYGWGEYEARGDTQIAGQMVRAQFGALSHELAVQKMLATEVTDGRGNPVVVRWQSLYCVRGSDQGAGVLVWERVRWNHYA